MSAAEVWTPPDGEFRPMLGARVHWVDFGGPAQPEALLVLVHGLGGSTVNWESLVPRLIDRFQCVALDLAGFGLTEPGPRRGTVEDNTTLLEAFVAAVSAEHPNLRVVLVGNSMGGLICARYASSRLGRMGAAATASSPVIAGVVLL
ncbi:MAG: alpha/beta hydrolase, partial [Ornithinimicrobium sp.]